MLRGIGAGLIGFRNRPPQILAGRGVTVNICAPSFIQKPTRRTIETGAARRRVEARSRAGTFGRAEDIANGALYLNGLELATSLNRC